MFQIVSWSFHGQNPVDLKGILPRGWNQKSVEQQVENTTSSCSTMRGAKRCGSGWTRTFEEVTSMTWLGNMKSLWLRDNIWFTDVNKVHDQYRCYANLHHVWHGIIMLNLQRDSNPFTLRKVRTLKQGERHLDIWFWTSRVWESTEQTSTERQRQRTQSQPSNTQTRPWSFEHVAAGRHFCVLNIWVSRLLTNSQEKKTKHYINLYN